MKIVEITYRFEGAMDRSGSGPPMRARSAAWTMAAGVCGAVCGHEVEAGPALGSFPSIARPCLLQGGAAAPRQRLLRRLGCSDRPGPLEMIFNEGPTTCS